LAWCLVGHFVEGRVLGVHGEQLEAFDQFVSGGFDGPVG
jgi:hypothetical protein